MKKDNFTTPMECFEKSFKGACTPLGCLEHGKVWTNYRAFWKYFETKFQGQLKNWINMLSTCITGSYLKKMMRSWNAVSSHSIAINFPRYLQIILMLEIMVKTTSLASLFHHVGHRNKSLCNSLFEFMFPFCNTCFQSTYLALFSLVRRPLNMTGKQLRILLNAN